MAETKLTEEEIRAKEEELRQKRQEIINNRCDLTSDVSDIGDYKITKTYEARLTDATGKSDPYDTADLIKKRDAVRRTINDLETECDALEKEIAEARAAL